jgi:hypothetical protein
MSWWFEIENPTNRGRSLIVYLIITRDGRQSMRGIETIGEISREEEGYF